MLDVHLDRMDDEYYKLSHKSLSNYFHNTIEDPNYHVAHS